MVDTGLLSANSGDGDVTKMLKTFYRLIIAKPDKSSFITVGLLSFYSVNY